MTSAHLIWGAGAFAVSALLVALLRRFPIAIDVPNARSSHERPVARGGGLAIVSVVLVAGSVPAAAATLSIAARAVFLVAGAGLAAVSLADDLRSVGTLPRMLVHACVAAGVLATAGSIEAFRMPWVATVELGLFSVPLTLLWIVGLTNAYNFMDGIDAIAAGQSIIAGSAWYILGLSAGDPWLARLGIVAAAGSLGFLLHNRPPARIFLGDVGSAFLGFLFASLAVFAARLDGGDRYATAGIACVWPFVVDSTFTFFRRLFRGENVFAAHRSHLYQRLVIAGLSHGAVALVYAVLASLAASVGVLYVHGLPGAESAAASVAIGTGPALWLFTRFAERRAKGRQVAGLATGES